MRTLMASALQANRSCTGTPARAHAERGRKSRSRDQASNFVAYVSGQEVATLCRTPTGERRVKCSTSW